MIIERNTFRQNFDRKPDTRQEFRGNIAETERKYTEERNTDYRDKTSNKKPYDALFGATAGILAGVIGWNALNRYAESLNSAIDYKSLGLITKTITEGKNRIDDIKKYRFGTTVQEILNTRRALGLQNTKFISTRAAKTMPDIIMAQSYDHLPALLNMFADVVSEEGQKYGLGSAKITEMRQYIGNVIKEYVQKQEVVAPNVDAEWAAQTISEIIRQYVPSFENQNDIDRVFAKLQRLVETTGYGEMKYGIGNARADMQSIVKRAKTHLVKLQLQTAADTHNVLESVIKGYVTPAQDKLLRGKVIGEGADIYSSLYSKVLNYSHTKNKQLRANVKDLFGFTEKEAMAAIGTNKKAFAFLADTEVRRTLVAESFLELYGSPAKLNKIARDQIKDDLVKIINDSTYLSSGKKQAYIAKLGQISDTFNNWKYIAQLYDDVVYNEQVQQQIINKNFAGQDQTNQSLLNDAIKSLMPQEQLNKTYLRTTVDPIVVDSKGILKSKPAEWALAKQNRRLYATLGNGRIKGQDSIISISSTQLDKILKNPMATKSELQVALNTVIDSQSKEMKQRAGKWYGFVDSSLNVVKANFVDDVVSARDKIFADSKLNTLQKEEKFTQEINNIKRKYITGIRISRTSDTVTNAGAKAVKKVAQYAEILNANGETIRRFQADFDIDPKHFPGVFGDTERKIMQFADNIRYDTMGNPNTSVVVQSFGGDGAGISQGDMQLSRWLYYLSGRLEDYHKNPQLELDKFDYLETKAKNPPKAIYNTWAVIKSDAEHNSPLVKLITRGKDVSKADKRYFFKLGKAIRSYRDMLKEVYKKDKRSSWLYFDTETLGFSSMDGYRDGVPLNFKADGTPDGWRGHAFSFGFSGSVFDKTGRVVDTLPAEIENLLYHDATNKIFGAPVLTKEGTEAFIGSQVFVRETMLNMARVINGPTTSDEYKQLEKEFANIAHLQPTEYMKTFEGFKAWIRHITKSENIEKYTRPLVDIKQALINISTREQDPFHLAGFNPDFDLRRVGPNDLTVTDVMHIALSFGVSKDRKHLLNSMGSKKLTEVAELLGITEKDVLAQMERESARLSGTQAHAASFDAVMTKMVDNKIRQQQTKSFMMADGTNVNTRKLSQALVALKDISTLFDTVGGDEYYDKSTVKKFLTKFIKKDYSKFMADVGGINQLKSLVLLGSPDSISKGNYLFNNWDKYAKVPYLFFYQEMAGPQNQLYQALTRQAIRRTEDTADPTRGAFDKFVMTATLAQEMNKANAILGFRTNELPGPNTLKRALATHNYYVFSSTGESTVSSRMLKEGVSYLVNTDKYSYQNALKNVVIYDEFATKYISDVGYTQMLSGISTDIDAELKEIFEIGTRYTKAEDGSALKVRLHERLLSKQDEIKSKILGRRLLQDAKLSERTLGEQRVVADIPTSSIITNILFDERGGIAQLEMRNAKNIMETPTKAHIGGVKSVININGNNFTDDITDFVYQRFGMDMQYGTAATILSGDYVVRKGRSAQFIQGNILAAAKDMIDQSVSPNTKDFEKVMSGKLKKLLTENIEEGNLSIKEADMFKKKLFHDLNLMNLSSKDMESINKWMSKSYAERKIGGIATSEKYLKYVFNISRNMMVASSNILNAQDIANIKGLDASDKLKYISTLGNIYTSNVIDVNNYRDIVNDNDAFISRLQRDIGKDGSIPAFLIPHKQRGGEITFLSRVLTDTVINADLTNMAAIITPNSPAKLTLKQADTVYMANILKDYHKGNVLGAMADARKSMYIHGDNTELYSIYKSLLAGTSREKLASGEKLNISAIEKSYAMFTPLVGMPDVLAEGTLDAKLKDFTKAELTNKVTALKNSGMILDLNLSKNKEALRGMIDSYEVLVREGGALTKDMIPNVYYYRGVWYTPEQLTRFFDKDIVDDILSNPETATKKVMALEHKPEARTAAAHLGGYARNAKDGVLPLVTFESYIGEGEKRQKISVAFHAPTISGITTLSGRNVEVLDPLSAEALPLVGLLDQYKERQRRLARLEGLLNSRGEEAGNFGRYKTAEGVKAKISQYRENMTYLESRIMQQKDKYYAAYRRNIIGVEKDYVASLPFGIRGTAQLFSGSGPLKDQIFSGAVNTRDLYEMFVNSDPSTEKIMSHYLYNEENFTKDTLEKFKIINKETGKLDGYSIILDKDAQIGTYFKDTKGIEGKYITPQDLLDYNHKNKNAFVKMHNINASMQLSYPITDKMTPINMYISDQVQRGVIELDHFTRRLILKDYDSDQVAIAYAGMSRFGTGGKAIDPDMYLTELLNKYKDRRASLEEGLSKVFGERYNSQRNRNLRNVRIESLEEIRSLISEVRSSHATNLGISPSALSDGFDPNTLSTVEEGMEFLKKFVPGIMADEDILLGRDTAGKNILLNISSGVIKDNKSLSETIATHDKIFDAFIGAAEGKKATPQGYFLARGFKKEVINFKNMLNKGYSGASNYYKMLGLSETATAEEALVMLNKYLPELEDVGVAHYEEVIKTIKKNGGFDEFNKALMNAKSDDADVSGLINRFHSGVSPEGFRVLTQLYRNTTKNMLSNKQFNLVERLLQENRIGSVYFDIYKSMNQRNVTNIVQDMMTPGQTQDVFGNVGSTAASQLQKIASNKTLAFAGLAIAGMMLLGRDQTPWYEEQMGSPGEEDDYSVRWTFNNPTRFTERELNVKATSADMLAKQYQNAQKLYMMRQEQHNITVEDHSIKTHKSRFLSIK